MNKKSHPLIQAERLCKSFRSPGGNPVEVLSQVSFSVHAGESISICGESGSGKTTLLHLLAGLEGPDTGEIFWSGNNINSLSSRDLCQKRTQFLGIIFQLYYLMPELNAFENVLFPRRLIATPNKADKARAMELLNEVKVGNRATYLPSTLSGGEKQRVALARALMNKPKIIIADEPTGSLDEKTGGQVMDLLLNLCQKYNTALILVTHNQTFARRTDSMYNLTGGKIQNLGC